MQKAYRFLNLLLFQKFLMIFLRNTWLNEGQEIKKIYLKLTYRLIYRFFESFVNNKIYKGQKNK